jgi:rhamnosyltransferase
MKIPSVAVLLAAFNGERWIEEQIKSMLIQKNIYAYIFISVNLSSDNTFQLCSKIEKKNSNIELLKYGLRFGSPAKNFYHLIKEVNINEFYYIALSDQDDIWMQNKLSCAIEKITSNKLDGYSSDVIAILNDERQKLVKKSFPKRKFDYYFEGGAPGCTF